LFFFVAFATPSPTFSSFFATFKTPSPRFGRKGACSPFFHFLMLMGHHGQVSAKGKLEFPLFFPFLVFFFWAQVGATTKSWQKVKLPPAFFVLLFLSIGGRHHQVLAQFGSPIFFGYF
jgi:hypothetical protein